MKVSRIRQFTVTALLVVVATKTAFAVIGETPWTLMQPTVKAVNYISTIDKKDGVRNVTNIKTQNISQNYYQSTGKNSNFPLTVFPFTKLILIGNSTYLDKPAPSDDLRAVDAIYKQNFINNGKNKNLEVILNKFAAEYGKSMGWGAVTFEEYLEDDSNVRSLIARLYSLDNARVSYQFGTGIWDPKSKDDVQVVTDALKEYFNKYESNLSKYQFTLDPKGYYNLDNITTAKQVNEFNNMLATFNGLN